MTPVNIPMNKNRLQIQRTDLCFGGDQVKDGLGGWDQELQTTIYKMHKQQGLTAEHKELYTIPCNKSQRKRKIY